MVAYRADALHDLVCTESVNEPVGESGGKKRLHPDVKIRVRVDLPVLLRGYPLGDEVCEIVGCGPVPVSVIHAKAAANGRWSHPTTHAIPATGPGPRAQPPRRDAA